MPIFIGKLDVGVIFDFQDLQKVPFEHNFLAKRFKRQGRDWIVGERPCRDPAFHKTKVIAVQL